MSEREINIIKILNNHEKYIRFCDYCGYDPYDALNSPLLSLLSCRNKKLRIAFVQFMRRFPINLRPLLMIRKGHNAKGLGLFLWGYADLGKIYGPERYSVQIRRLLDLLSSYRSNCRGNGWGYNFDWQSRAFWVPKNTPTIVNSSFIGHALLDLWLITKEQRSLDLAVPIKDFILKEIKRTYDGDSFCFSYTPVDNLVVHNANLLGSSLLMRLFKITGESDLREASLASLSWSMSRQDVNGSWPFGETSYQAWIDSFHTGFNLQSLRYILQEGEGIEYEKNYENGVQFYVNNFFLTDGTPKYFYNRVYPIDIHSSAQAIVFLSGESEKYEELNNNILNWMLNNMYNDRENYFYFRRGRKYTNKISYMRWGQAWAFHALSTYLARQKNMYTCNEEE